MSAEKFPALKVAGAKDISVVGQLLHLPWPGSTPHKHLPVRPDRLDDLPDLWLEAYVKHPVCLVQDQIGRSPQVVCLQVLFTINFVQGKKDKTLEFLLPG